nr:hypothetical protein Ade03nite_09180 [Actinoplanes derwentensis]
MIEALRTPILEPHDHLHIKQIRAPNTSIAVTQGNQVGGSKPTSSCDIGSLVPTNAERCQLEPKVTARQQPDPPHPHTA